MTLKFENKITPEWTKFVKAIVNKFYCSKKYILLTKQDLEQEAWLALLKAAKNFDEKRSTLFSTYAYSYIYKELLKYIHRKVLPKKLDSQCEILHQNVELIRDPVSLEKKSENNNLINHALSILDKRDQAIVKLYFIDDFNYKQIAHAINMSQVMVSKRLDQALIKMRRILSEKS